MAGNRKQVRCINHIFYAYHTWLETENRSGVSITSSMPIIHGWKQKAGHVYQSHPLCLLYMAGNRKQNRSGVSITSSMPKIAYYTWLETENRSGVSITSSMPIIHGWKQKTGQVYQLHLLCLLYMARNRKQVRCINRIFYAYYTWLETENRSGVSIKSSMPIIHGWKQKTGQVYQSHLLCLLYMAGNTKQVRCINHISYAYYTWLETRKQA